MKKTSAGVGVVIVLALIVAGLAYGFFNRRVSIGSINKDPMAFNGQLVIVSGKVAGRLSIGSFSMYYLEDDTGKIRVRVHDGSLPGMNEKVTVKGTVSSLFKVGDYTLGTAIEEKQRW